MILPDLISFRAKEAPERTALVFRDERLSYGQLEDKVLRCAQGLADLGIRKGDAFGLILRNSPEFVILSMALSRLGAMTVPINFLEKADRIALILNDAGAVGLLTSKEFYRNAAGAAKKVPTLRHFFLRDAAHKEFRAFADLLAAPPWKGTSPVSDDDIMMLLYTSGTTGQPKGVMLTHGNLLANVDQCIAAISLSPRDRFLCLLPLFHAFAWTTCMLIPLKLGAMIVVIESLLPFDPVIKAIWKNKITLFVAVPQIFGALTSRIKGLKALVLRLLNPVRVAISGAAPLPAIIHQGFEKTFGVPLIEGYGLTEASPVVALNPASRRKVGTVGRLLPGIAARIVDDDGRDVKKGEVGEIWIRGKNVMKGYYRKPEETTASLTSDGWLKTGDMGRFDEDDYLVIADRKKDLIIVKGLNVYPQEIENVIAAHDSVREVAVIGKPDPATGEEIIRAFVTAREGKVVDKAELFRLCREHLAAYKLPKDIVVLDEMPKNALQKILKKDLRSR